MGALRRAGRVLAFVAFCLAVLVFDLWAFLRSPWGARVVASQAERIVSDLFAGDVLAGKVRTIGVVGVHLQDAAVLDPVGDPVITVRDLRVTLVPWRLLVGELAADVRIRGARVAIVEIEEQEDVNIGLAFEPEEPGPDEPDDEEGPSHLPPPPPLPIVLHRLAIDETAFLYAESKEAPPVVLVRDISIRASGKWDDRSADTRLTLSAKALEPVQAPVAVDVQGAFAESWLDALGVEVSVGGTRISARGRGEMLALEGRVVARGKVGAEEARAVGIPLASDVRLDLDVFLSRLRTTGAVHLDNPGGMIAIDGWYDRRDTDLGAQVLLAGVDPAAWFLDLPDGDLTGTVRLSGVLEPHPLLDLALRIESGRLEAQPIGPVEIQAGLRDDRIALEQAAIDVPGARLQGEGNASERALDLRGSAAVRDAGALARFLESVGGPRLPSIGGRGDVHLHVRGSPMAPRLDLQLRAPDLAVEGNRARDVDLQADLLLGGPLPSGTVEGRIGSLATDGLLAGDLHLQIERAPGGAFSVQGRTVTRRRTQRGSDRLRLDAEGHLDEEGARVDRFVFDFPLGTLTNRGPATLDLEAGDFQVEGLELHLKEGGRLLVEGGLQGRAIDARVHGTDLRLERLPSSLLPVALAGRLEIDGHIGGTVQAPVGQARFRVTDGIWGTLEDLGARGEVQLEGGRAKGKMAAALGGVGRVDADFDLPLDPLGAPPGAPVRLDLRTGPVRLQGLGLALGEEMPGGIVIGRVQAAGAIGNPDVQVDLFLSRFTIPGAEDLPEIAAHLRAHLDRNLALVEAEAWTGDVRILELEASAPLDPRHLRSTPIEEIERMLGSPLSRAQISLRALDLELVAGLLDMQDLDGAALAEVSIQGPILDPRGQGRIELRGGPFGPIRMVDLIAEIDLLPERSHLLATLSLDQEAAAEIRAEVQAPIRAFVDGTASGATPALLVIDLPTLDLGRLGSRAAVAAAAELVQESRGTSRETYGGTLAARGHFEGTLAELPGNLHVVAEDLVFRGVELGSAELFLEQREGLDLQVLAIDPTAGTLVATARLDRPLSPVALADGAQLLQVGAEVEAVGQGLSLGPLATISTIQRASGTVDFEARAQGPLALLDPVGQLAVRDGALQLVGGPRYQDVTVDLQLTGERMLLARLQAASPGRGRLEADGRLERTEGADPFSFEVVASEFPIGGPGGVAARISGEGQLEGSADPRAGVHATFTIPRATIRLPASPPRTLQSVSRLEEVVIVTGPEAFLRERRQQLASAEKALPLSLHIDAPRRIFVTGEDVSAELGVDLRLLRPASGDLVAEGRVRAIRGRVQVIGRSFVVEEGNARWGGGPLADPILFLTARFDAADATAWVDVTGSASRPVISLRSDPPLPESQIALLIASGRTQLPGQRSALGDDRDDASTPIRAEEAAVSVAGSFAAQQLRQALGPRLPLDVLSLETGGEGAHLEAGTYVSDRLYLGFLRNFLPDEDENRNEVRAEYELSRTISIESRFGDRGAAGVDLVWEKPIATPAQQRARREERQEGESGEAPQPGPPPESPEPAPAPGTPEEEGGEEPVGDR